MRLKVKLPKVEPNNYRKPESCPYGCGSQNYRPHGTQGERKALRDIGYAEVVSYRYECVRCGRSFRVYPQGVSKGAQQSERLRALTAILYVLGLSYGGVEDLTLALGIEVVVDDHTGELLGLEIISSECHDEIIKVIQDVIAEVDAEVLVSDDHGAYQAVVDDTGVAHQICRSHAKRNVDNLAESLTQHLKRAEPLPDQVDLTPTQVAVDLALMQQLIRERPVNAEEQLAQMYDRYKAVPPPKFGERHTVWYCTRMMVTRLWLRWPALTLDQRRSDLNGTNNACERLIGWWIKERYRTMRGYKREESIKNVATLTARIGACPGFYDLSELMA